MKDGNEYAAKMRELTPNTKDDLAKGFVGRSVTRFKAFTVDWLDSKDSFLRLSVSLMCMCACVRLEEVSERARERERGHLCYLHTILVSCICHPLSLYPSFKCNMTGRDSRIMSGNH